MKAFLINNREIVWFGAVVFFTIMMIIISRICLRFSRRRWSRGAEFSDLFGLLETISKIFFSVLGIVLISYLFFDREVYQFINKNLGRVIWIGLVSSTTVIGSAMSGHYFNKKMTTVSRRDQGDVTTYKYLKYLVGFGFYFLGLILIALAIPGLKSFATAAAGGAGIFALIAGVAAQEGLANLTGGLIIAFFKPFRIGDIIKVGNDVMGRVEDLNLRHTVINNFQNKRVVIPNAMVNKENITNYYLGEFKICEWIEVGISYDSSMDKAMRIMREECEDHQYCMDNRSEKDKIDNKPLVDVQVVGLGDSSVNLKAWVWCASYMTGFTMRNDLYKSIKTRFDCEVIEIPFPHTTVVIKK